MNNMVEHAYNMEIGNSVHRDRDDNPFLGIVDTIMSNLHPVKRIIDKIITPTSKYIDMVELETMFKHITRSVVSKLYKSNVGVYSLRDMMNRVEYDPSVVDDMLDNVAYAVLTSASQVALSSLLYYFNKDFIYLYIRETIVEPNYRDYITEARERFEKPSKAQEELVLAKEFTVQIRKIIDNLLVHGESNTYDVVRSDFTRILEKTPIERRRSVLDTEFSYPIPSFLYSMITGMKLTEKEQIDTSEFLEEYTTTFSKDGLRRLFKTYGGSDCVGAEFETKLNRLYIDRSQYNSIEADIDGLSMNEHHVVNVMMKMDPLNHRQRELCGKSKILSNMYDILTKYNTTGTRVLFEKGIMKVISNNEESFYSLKGDSVVEDLHNPFRVFGKDATLAKQMYEQNPDKSPVNQLIRMPIDLTEGILSGRTHDIASSLPVEQKIRKNNALFDMLMRDKTITSNSNLINRINLLLEGNFDKTTFLKAHNFKPIEISDKATILLYLAEQKGLRKKIRELSMAKSAYSSYNGGIK